MVKVHVYLCTATGVLVSPQPDQEGNKLQRQKILIFIYPIYYHNWRNIINIYIYIYNKTSIKRNILTIKKIHREVGRAKDLSVPRYSRSSKFDALLCHFYLERTQQIQVWWRESHSLVKCADMMCWVHLSTVSHSKGKLL